MGVRIVVMAAWLLIGCDSVGVAPNEAEAEASARGREATQRLGCGACHAIPGVWPAGTSAPPLTRLRDRAMIAGRYANRSDTLAAFLLDPSATAMPRQPMTAREARDIAAFLYALDAR